MRGKNTSPAEILNVSKEGLWMFIQGKEFFLPYHQYPWFKNATVKELYTFELVHGSSLHWPDLDVDLTIDSLHHPENFPLVARLTRKVSGQRAA